MCDMVTIYSLRFGFQLCLFGKRTVLNDFNSVFILGTFINVCKHRHIELFIVALICPALAVEADRRLI